mmetsp:Transcript_61043/g.125923  ORF Transcript_61043/g.125923 Transcript_61043/m.125923 type:complete len:219 (+) Transcript_61043:1305-1961(+)
MRKERRLGDCFQPLELQAATLEEALDRDEHPQSRDCKHKHPGVHDGNDSTQHGRFHAPSYEPVQTPCNVPVELMHVGGESVQDPARGGRVEEFDWQANDCRKHLVVQERGGSESSVPLDHDARCERRGLGDVDACKHCDVEHRGWNGCVLSVVACRCCFRVNIERGWLDTLPGPNRQPPPDGESKSLVDQHRYHEGSDGPGPQSLAVLFPNLHIHSPF